VESWFGTGRKYVRNQTTSTSAQYFLAESNGTEVDSNQYDIKFTDTNGQLSFNIEPTDGQNVPEYWRINNSGSFFINGNLSVGDDIWCYKDNQTTVKCRFTVPDFFSSSTPTQPTIPNKIDVSPVIHAGHDFYYLSGGSGVGSSYVEGDVLVYAYRAENEQAYYRTIQYQSGVWSDLNLTENPTDVATNNNSQNISITLGNTYSTGFVNPFYEAPALNWWENGYGALPVITGTGALNGQSFSFYAEDSSHIEFVLSSTASASNPSTIKFTKSDVTWVDGTSGDWPSQVNYDSTNVILRTNTWTNEFVNPNTSSPYTPVAVLMEDLRNATPVSSPSAKSFTYKSGSGTIADPWIYGEAYYSTGALVNSTDTAKTIKWPASNYTGEGSGWADNDTASYPEVSNTGSTINITRFSNAHFSFTDPYYNHLPPA